MKIKLTPDLSYAIGLWVHRKSRKGIGIIGDEELISHFAKVCLDQKLTEPGKMLYSEDEIFFYNSAMKKFFETVFKERIDRYKYGNEYAMAYLAGLFDSLGSVEKGRVIMKNLDVFDKTLLETLKMIPKEYGRFTVIGKDKAFLKFISPYVQKNKAILESAKI